MSDKTAAATSSAMMKELAEQNAWLQQRSIANAARAGAAEARVQELSGELAAAREHAAAVEAELKSRQVPDPPASNVVSMEER